MKENDLLYLFLTYTTTKKKLSFNQSYVQITKNLNSTAQRSFSVQNSVLENILYQQQQENEKPKAWSLLRPPNPYTWQRWLLDIYLPGP